MNDTVPTMPRSKDAEGRLSIALNNYMKFGSKSDGEKLYEFMGKTSIQFETYTNGTLMNVPGGLFACCCMRAIYQGRIGRVMYEFNLLTNQRLQRNIEQIYN